MSELYFENNTNPNTIVGGASVTEHCADSGMTATGTVGARYRSYYGTVSEDATSQCSDFGHTAATVTRVNLSGKITRAGTNVLSGTGDQEPANILVNGDFSRWNGATPDMWELIGTTTATRCGVGCVDTTRTAFAANCSQFTRAGAPWYARKKIMDGPLPEHLLNCPVSVSVKGKASSGSIVLCLSYVGDLDFAAYGAPAGSPTCESGFTHYSAQTLITQDMLDHGIELHVGGGSDTTCYLSEATCALGYVHPRSGVRATEVPGIACKIEPTGKIIFPADAIPRTAVNPWGGAYIDGDRGVVAEPVEVDKSDGTTYTVDGWVRSAGFWVPCETIASVASSVPGRLYRDVLAELGSTLKFFGLADDLLLDGANIASCPMRVGGTLANLGTGRMQTTVVNGRLALHGVEGHYSTQGGLAVAGADAIKSIWVVCRPRVLPFTADQYGVAARSYPAVSDSYWLVGSGGGSVWVTGGAFTAHQKNGVATPNVSADLAVYRSDASANTDTGICIGGANSPTVQYGWEGDIVCWLGSSAVPGGEAATVLADIAAYCGITIS